MVSLPLFYVFGIRSPGALIPAAHHGPRDRGMQSPLGRGLLGCNEPGNRSLSRVANCAWLVEGPVKP